MLLGEKDKQISDILHSVKNKIYQVFSEREVSGTLDIGITYPVTAKIVVNRSNYIKKDDRVLLQIEFKQGSKRKYVSSGVYIPDIKYFKNGRLLKSCPNFVYYNSSLKLTQDNIYKTLSYFNRTFENYSLEGVVNAYKKNVGCQMSLIDFFKANMLDDNERNGKTASGYVTTINSFGTFIKNPTIADLTIENIKAYDKKLKETLRPNTITTRHNHLRCLANKAVKLKLLKENPYNDFKIKGYEKKHGSPTAEQIQQLKELKLSGDLEKTRDCLILDMMIGARHEDFVKLKNENFDGKWLRYVADKNKYPLEIPYAELFNGETIEILNKYRGIEPLAKFASDYSKFRNYVLEVYKMIGIGKDLNGTNYTFHTCRHAFGTQLLLQGFDLPVISKLLGHYKIQTTMTYLDIDRTTIESNLKRIKEQK